MGYGHIGAEHAEAVQKFYMAHLNPIVDPGIQTRQ